MASQAVIWKAGQGKSVTMKGEPLTFLVTGEATRHTSIFEWVIPPGFETGVHVHKVQEETFYVVEGECLWVIDGEPFAAERGAFVFIPPGVAHNIMNPGPSTAKVLMTVSPPGHEHYFEELSSILNDPSPPNAAEIGKLRARYDTEQVSALFTIRDASARSL